MKRILFVASVAINCFLFGMVLRQRKIIGRMDNLFDIFKLKQVANVTGDEDTVREENQK